MHNTKRSSKFDSTESTQFNGLMNLARAAEFKQQQEILASTSSSTIIYINIPTNPAKSSAADANKCLYAVGEILGSLKHTRGRRANSKVDIIEKYLTTASAFLGEEISFNKEDTISNRISFADKVFQKLWVKINPTQDELAATNIAKMAME